MECAQPSGSTTALGPAGPSATTNGYPGNGQDNNGMYDLDTTVAISTPRAVAPCATRTAMALAATGTTTTTKTARQTMTPRSIL